MIRKLFRLHEESPKRLRVLVLGAGARGKQLAELSESLGAQQIELVAFAAVEPPSALPTGTPRTDETLVACVKRLAIDEIVVAADELRDRLPVSALLDCKLAGISVVSDGAFLERQFGAVRLETLRPSDVIYSEGFTRAVRRTHLKRVVDLTLASLIGVLTLPLMILAALAIALETGAPIFYRQRRVGLHGRNFDVLKFRSMQHDAECDGRARWATPADPRITRVGRLLRQCRLDELPQLWNVLQGDMSIIGPRPGRPEFVAQFNTSLPFYDLRHQVKPGITGWAQVSYPYGASLADAREKLQFELYYLKHHSMWLDLSILLMTVLVVLSGKGAR